MIQSGQLFIRDRVIGDDLREFIRWKSRVDNTIMAVDFSFLR